MQYTLGQAKKALVESAHAYGQDDIRELINRAIQALSGMAGWECLRKVLRFSSAGPGFVLPQGCAGLVRACVNGRPTTVRGQDFRFLQSGPGDLRHPPRGFCHVHADNIEDIGMKPVMIEPPNRFRLFAYTKSGNVLGDGSTPVGTADNPSGEYSLYVTVRGVSPDGELRSVKLKPHKVPAYDATGTSATDGDEISSIELTDGELVDFQMITEVTIPNDAYEYYYLYAEDQVTGHRFMIGQYHPEIKAPEFRHYEIVCGIPPHHPIELLVETRIDPIPLIEDTDILPFSCLEPIEWMIRADWQMKAGEVTAATNYQNKAAQWLKAQEITYDTVQTQVVINSIFEGSPGEISADSVNI